MSSTPGGRGIKIYVAPSSHLRTAEPPQNSFVSGRGSVRLISSPPSRSILCLLVNIANWIVLTSFPPTSGVEQLLLLDLYLGYLLQLDDAVEGKAVQEGLERLARVHDPIAPIISASKIQAQENSLKGKATAPPKFQRSLSSSLHIVP